MSCEEGEGGGVNLSWNKILGWGEERKKGQRGEMSFLPLNSTGGGTRVSKLLASQIFPPLFGWLPTLCTFRLQNDINILQFFLISLAPYHLGNRPRGILGSIFAGYVPLASPDPPHPYPIIVYSVANYRPHVSHFWANIPRIPTCWNLLTPEIPQMCDPILVTLLAPNENATPS